MIIVEFLGPIGEEKMEFDITSLRELKSKLENIPNIAKWLPMSAIAVNDVLVDSLDIPLNKGDKIVVLPPVCGG